MGKKIAVVVILIVVIFGTTFTWDVLRMNGIKNYAKNYQAPPVYVSATTVKLATWHPVYNSVGSLTAINGVEISPELSGQIVKILFDSGEMVKKDQGLIQLDDEVNQQQLKIDMAQMQLNQVNYQRQLRLYETRATSKSELDNAAAKLAQSQAAVASDNVNINKKLIKAPFSGKVGIRTVNLGQYVKPGDKLVSLQQLNPLFCDFSLPEQDLKNLRVDMPVKMHTETYPNEVFTGKITGINSQVDINTRTIEVRATIPNPDHKLYPGIYADVQVVLPEKKNVVTVPQTAVTFTLYGDSVFIIDSATKDKQGKVVSTVKQQFVKVGERRGTAAEILSGLKAGQQVVTSGQIKLQNGDRVIINNTVKMQ